MSTGIGPDKNVEHRAIETTAKLGARVAAKFLAYNVRAKISDGLISAIKLMCIECCQRANRLS